ncbi:hypothetical protein BKA60DRAFT_460404 [Fusarium oxysporum]|nr:hypothetical protein BKA60DRAFT_460404 [Fusarium oxysporum]
MRLTALYAVITVAVDRLGALAEGLPVVINVPRVASDDAASLDPSPVSFSLPFAGLPGYFPGIPLTLKCLGTFKDEELLSKYGGVNPGWLTAADDSFRDYATFDPNLAVPNVITGTAPTGQGISTYGPLLMRLVADYQGPIVWGLNRGGNNITNTIAAAKAAVKQLPSLYALELGNEPVIFGAIKQPIASTVNEWTPETDAESESEWQAAIGQAINRNSIFQAASYYQNPTLEWSAANYFKYANASADKYIKVFSHHNYPQSAISSQEDPPNAEALMSHINVTKNVGLYKDDVKAAQARGFDYVFGETNSVANVSELLVSGNGSPGQGETFATGLWVLDYALQAASIGIKRLYFHQGTAGKSYYVWFNEKGVLSPFYGGYVAAQAMAGGSRIQALDGGSTNYAGYSIHGSNGKVKKLVLINTDFFNGNGTRSTQKFVLKNLSSKRVSAMRLTAKSSLSRQDDGEAPTFAGISVDDSTCQPSGKTVVETVDVTGGSASFNLAASEALLITLIILRYRKVEPNPVGLVIAPR